MSSLSAHKSQQIAQELTASLHRAYEAMPTQLLYLVLVLVTLHALALAFYCLSLFRDLRGGPAPNKPVRGSTVKVD